MLTCHWLIPIEMGLFYRDSHLDKKKWRMNTVILGRNLKICAHLPV